MRCASSAGVVVITVAATFAFCGVANGDTIIKIGPTGDPASQTVPTPFGWNGRSVDYPASVPFAGTIVGQPSYNDSIDIACKRAIEIANSLPEGERVYLVGSSQGGDAALRAANALGLPVITVGGPDGRGASARVLPNIPGVTFYQGDANPGVYHIRQIITGDGVAALRNPFEGGNAPNGTFANGVGYVLYHLGVDPVNNYSTFRVDRIKYDEQGEIQIMDAPHPLIRVAELIGLNPTDEQEAQVKAWAPVGEPGEESWAPTPQEVLNLGGAPSGAPPSTTVSDSAQAVAADPAVAAAQQVWDAHVTMPLAQAVEAWTNPVAAAAGVDPASQVAATVTGGITDLQAQAGRFFAPSH